MFGFALPDKEHLTREEIGFLTVSYCGLCQELRARYGLLAAAAASYDSLFLVTLAAAQRAQAPELGPSTRCPLAGFLDQKKTLGDSAALQYAAAVTVLLVSHKLEDDARDNHRVHEALLLSSIRRQVAEAQDILNQAWFPLATVGTLRTAQEEIEYDPPGSLMDCLEPTAQLVGLIFAHTAAIAQTQENAPILTSLGRSVGRIVALADACEDLLRDIRDNTYNPIRGIWRLQPAQPVPAKVMCEICEVLAEQYFSITRNLQQLQIPRLAHVINNVLSLGMPFRTQISLSRLWHFNHWAGSWLLQMTPGTRAQLCRTCGVPHLWDRTRSSRKHSPLSGLWLLGTMFENANVDAQELGFANQGEYLLASALPVITSTPPAAVAVWGSCDDFAHKGVKLAGSL